VNPRVVLACTYGLGLVLLVGLASVGLSASGTSAPEIDGGTLTTGLGLLTASVMVLRARRSK
jgi:hypothetical protein